MDTEYQELNKPRLLLVDDNPAIHEDLIKVLSRSNEEEQALASEAADIFGDDNKSNTYSLDFEVDSAYQGEEAFVLVSQAFKEKRRYSLAFVDIRMPPGWDGIETIGHLWKVDPALHVIVCTAFSDYSLDDIIEKIGLSDHLVILKKPFDNIEALQLANALTHKWRLQEESNNLYEELLRRNDQAERNLEDARQKIKELEAMVERQSR